MHMFRIPILTNAVLVVLAGKSRTETRLTIPEKIILSLSLVLPVIMMETWQLSMIRTVPLLLLFALVVWLNFRSDRSQSLVSGA